MLNYFTCLREVDVVLYCISFRTNKLNKNGESHIEISVFVLTGKRYKYCNRLLFVRSKQFELRIGTRNVSKIQKVNQGVESRQNSEKY